MCIEDISLQSNNFFSNCNSTCYWLPFACESSWPHKSTQSSAFPYSFFVVAISVRNCQIWRLFVPRNQIVVCGLVWIWQDDSVFLKCGPASLAHLAKEKQKHSMLQNWLLNYKYGENPVFHPNCKQNTRGAGELNQHTLWGCTSLMLVLSHPCLMQPSIPVMTTTVGLNLLVLRRNSQSDQFGCQRNTPISLDQMMKLCTLQRNAQVLLCWINLDQICNWVHYS